MIKQIIVLTGIVLLVGMAGPTHAAWFVYAKPKFLGRVIDARTREPIVGVVVAVYYTKRSLLGSGGSAEIIHATEVATDKRGQFIIEPFWRIIGPFAVVDIAEFIIYQPGYASYPDMFPLRINPEIFFSTDKVGVKGMVRRDDQAVSFTYGVLELPAMETPRERIHAIPILPDGIGAKDFPGLKRVIAAERRSLGLDGAEGSGR